MSRSSYVVWFRGRPACPCLAEWLPVFEAELLRRGVIKQSIDIAQLIGGAAASGGTHATGGAFDIWQHDETTISVARQMGAAAWARTAAQGFDPHTHGVLRGCPHNGPAAYQIAALDKGFNGLGSGGMSAKDDGPRPVPLRTWDQGIEWALQQEDEMKPEDFDKIREIVEKAVDDKFTQRLGNGRTFMSTVNLIAEKVGVKARKAE